MFAAANSLARRFTFPMIVSTRHWKRSVETAVGAFVVLNRDGWIVTTAHAFGLVSKAQADAPKVAAHAARVAAVRADSATAPDRLERELAALEETADPTWITNVSTWCGRDGVALRDVRVVPAADIAIGRLDPALPEMLTAVPVLKNPATGLDPGRSLCRLGFAFTKVKATFDESVAGFRVQGEVPYFPLEGMFTRIVDAGQTPDRKFRLRFIETSSPGLRGQSGGPLFDVDGRIWGIQSRTQHLALGFNPEAEIAGKKSQVPQFINLGLAVHVGTLIEILADAGIAHEVSPG
ncbi:MAG: serine protease [Chloroflexota bacterium]|nr:MAG: serine protease [Chloroflexota bacterium]